MIQPSVSAISQKCKEGNKVTCATFSSTVRVDTISAVRSSIDFVGLQNTGNFVLSQVPGAGEGAGDAQYSKSFDFGGQRRTLLGIDLALQPFFNSHNARFSQLGTNTATVQFACDSHSWQQKSAVIIFVVFEILMMSSPLQSRFCTTAQSEDFTKFPFNNATNNRESISRSRISSTIVGLV